MDREAEQACHELLLRLSGRLPDNLIWRFRDWSGEGAMSTLARVLPKTLLKHRVDLDQEEHGLLVAGLVPHGADRHQVSSTLGVDAPLESGYTFTASTPNWVNSVDSVAAVIDATLRRRPDVGEVREAWRQERGSGPEGAKRVLLVTATAGLPRLTGELQRVLRVLGEETPCVEVLPVRFELPAYHREALANSRFVCAGAADAGRQLVSA